MNKPVTKKDGLYKEALAWMSYRYAMGMTDYVSRKGYSELERYRQFMDIEFGSYEFRALVNVSRFSSATRAISNMPQN